MFLSVIVFLFTLVVLVVIHEFGHFFMAKKFGVKVEEFGFGIPPRIWGKKIGETIFSLNWIPLGGFVRLLGEDATDQKVLQNPRSFASKTPLQRIIIVVAGVVMNLVLSWIIFYGVIIYGNFRVIYPSQESAAFIGFVEKGFPAEQAGVKVGDKITEVDGQKVEDYQKVKGLIKDKKGEAVNLTILGDKDARQITIIPKKADNGDYLIGVGFSPIPFKQYNTPLEKIFSGITYSYDLTLLTFQGLGKTIGDLFTGKFETASQSVTGPVGMASATNDILKGGSQALPFYFWFVGVISLTLTIFNVLPIPALDGGRLFFIIIEAILGRKVKAEVEGLIHQVGFMILLGLALLITLSDIRKFLL